MNRRLLFTALITSAAWGLLRTPHGRFPWPPPNATPRPVALITGASAGIGAEYARQLAARGIDLTLVARRAERLHELARSLTAAHGVHCEVLVADLAHDEGVSLVEAHIRSMDNLAILVNNAGFGTVGRLVNADPRRQQEMIQLHVMAPMRLTQAALPGMIARRHGAIINVASVAAYWRFVGNVNYAATKAYLVAFSEGLQIEVRGGGVHVQALCPGFTRTEFHHTEEYKKHKPRRYPGFLWMSAEEVVRQSLDALGNGRVVVVPGLFYRALVLALRTPVIGETLMRIGRLVVSG
ncbi:MAG: SDR family oxidoreductase [Caldilinea sp.]|nr:SDR family oxidoreductase [Caldilinea sp.]MDW8440593.1 SDR family oxidoreductase [Caldilineaceae bacterium]